MTDSRRALLGGLALLNKDDDERKPAAPRTREALDEAHEAQERMDAMDEDPDEDEDAEGDSEDSEPGRYLVGENRRLRTKLGEYRSANIAATAKLVAAGNEIRALERALARATVQTGELRDKLATLEAENPEILESDEDADDS